MRGKSKTISQLEKTGVRWNLYFYLLEILDIPLVCLCSNCSNTRMAVVFPKLGMLLAGGDAALIPRVCYLLISGANLKAAGLNRSVSVGFGSKS